MKTSLLSDMTGWFRLILYIPCPNSKINHLKLMSHAIPFTGEYYLETMNEALCAFSDFEVESSANINNICSYLC